MWRNITPCWNHSYWLQLTNQTPPTQPIFLWLVIKCMEEERGGKGNGGWRVGGGGGGGGGGGMGGEGNCASLQSSNTARQTNSQSG